ncbi:DUF4331 domain-containing protein [Antrihabitans cavernicola]|uniref:DUF4331 domain-containing protein n=1 Tax=Antrihabitans cavernicola TaxID=2495913 RepID=A0A5A7S3V4_9NOCA|nr:DUF4331 domain-containing protein [Spelaeibacter cavernicola]KAA0016558.1 DUF4331 domain-containing protein [Spelaeibacter cavernicola]
MSSHREAPEISMDPVADSTDVYAFVSPDRPDTVTLIANYVPLQDPDGGPNFFAFGDDVLYEIHIANKGTADSDITYQFRFSTEFQNDATFLYNTGAITSLTDATYNRRQVYTVTRVKDGQATVLGSGICPPNNIGPHSTPDYAGLAGQAVYHFPSGETVFAGQRADAFYIDLGAIFDLLDIRPLQLLHTGPLGPGLAYNTLQGVNVHSIAIQVPKTMLTADGSDPVDWRSPSSVIGVYSSASRQASRVYDSKNGGVINSGPWVQVSRLANPLFNELLIPITRKDYWNAKKPKDDHQFLDRVEHPEVAKLLPGLYPNVFNSLAGYGKARADLVAILLTGLPEGVIPGFQNFTGPVQADLVRLNMAIPVNPKPNSAGLLGPPDLQGYPNGRRPLDNVTTVILRAVAGLTIPLVDKSFIPDLAVPVLQDFAPMSNSPLLGTFPYLGLPNSGFGSIPSPTLTG